MSILNLARRARAYFPLAPRKQRVSQAAAYAAAMKYLLDHGLYRGHSPRLPEPRPV